MADVLQRLSGAIEVIGTFVPTFTFGTPGDLSVSYATQLGAFRRLGSLLYVDATLTFTPTFTTAAGNARFAGFPVAANLAQSVTNGLAIRTITPPSTAWVWPTNATQIGVQAISGQTYAELRAFGAACANTAIATTHLTSGQAHTIAFGGCFGI